MNDKIIPIIIGILFVAILSLMPANFTTEVSIGNQSWAEEFVYDDCDFERGLIDDLYEDVVRCHDILSNEDTKYSYVEDGYRYTCKGIACNITEELRSGNEI